MADLADIGTGNIAETKPDWQANRPSLYMPATQSGYALPRDPITGAPGSWTAPVISTLMQWGPHIQFQIWPLNYHEMDHETSTAWAVKPIVGAANYREWVGELDEVRTLRGRIFPYRIGGMNEIEIMDAYRRGGIVNLMVDGAGRDLGWFVLEKHSRQHTRISAEGIGQMIEFSAVFARVPQPDPAAWLAQEQAIGVNPEPTFPPGPGPGPTAAAAATTSPAANSAGVFPPGFILGNNPGQFGGGGGATGGF